MASGGAWYHLPFREGPACTVTFDSNACRCHYLEFWTFGYMYDNYKQRENNLPEFKFHCLRTFLSHFKCLIQTNKKYRQLPQLQVPFLSALFHDKIVS